MGGPAGQFDQDSAVKIGKAVRQVLGQTPGSSPVASGGAVGTRFYVKLGDEDTTTPAPGHYKWTKQLSGNGTFSADTPTSGSNYTAIEVNKTPGLHGRIVEILFAGYQTVEDTTTAVYWFAGSNACFPVALTSDGGDDGTSGSGAASWTYTIKTQDGSTTLATGVSPETRVWGGAMTVATIGIAWWDGSNVKLRHAGEQIIIGVACDPDCDS